MKRIIFAVAITVSFSAYANGYKVVKVDKEIPGVDHYHILKCDNGKKKEVLEYPKKSEFWYAGKKYSSLSAAARGACK